MSRVLKILAPLVVLALGVGGAMLFIQTKPTVTRDKPEAKPVSVRVSAASPTNATLTVSGMGTVVPSRQIVLRSEVSGTVIHIDPQFTPGGHLDAGRVALRIDPREYTIDLHQAQSALAKARADFRLEQGQQDVALQELQMLQNASNASVRETDLALRRPQLHKARADVAQAQADVEQAQLNLSRTQIRVPFNALVTDRQVNTGSQVTVQDSLATLVGTDTYWVRVAVPLDRLQFLQLPKEEGSVATIFSQTGQHTWSGRALRLTGRLQDQTRMATLLVEVPDPLGLDKVHHPLMLGDYVRVEVQGVLLTNVFPVPRKALHARDTVWVVDQGRLDIRSVQTAWKGREQVYIRQGLAAGDQVVLSQLATPVQGMRLQVR